MEQRVLSSRPSSLRTEVFNCSRFRMRKGCSCSQSGASTRRSKSNARAPVIGFGWAIIHSLRRLGVDVLGEVPLRIDVALFRTFGLLRVEVPGDVVVVQRHGLNRFVS